MSGTWRDLTENVNSMAGNLTDQVRNIAQVTTAVANGDLSQKITVEAKGEVAELADTINTMVDQLRSFAAEVTRVAREVGTEGKLGGQAEVEGVVRHVARPDRERELHGVEPDRPGAQHRAGHDRRRQRRPVAEDHRRGQGRDRRRSPRRSTRWSTSCASFAAEVTRVAREVGTEGKLGGQAEVEGVSGTWRGPDREREHDGRQPDRPGPQHRRRSPPRSPTATCRRRSPSTRRARSSSSKTRSTRWSTSCRSFAAEVTRVAREVGTEGKLGGQAEVEGVAGTWRGLTENVNLMADNLTDQVRNIAQVATAVANGDLTQKITVDASGEILQLKNTINTMVDQLSSFADEVTRVAREVGTEGKLGGQAEVEGVSGTWRDLTENVNQLGVEPDDAGARDRRGVHRGDPGRPDAVDHRRGAGRGRGAEGQHQPDDRQPARDDAAQRGAGLAEDQPRAHLRPDAGPARPADGLAADHVAS